MFAARECFSKTDDSDSLWDELNSTTKSTVSELDTSVESSTASEKLNGMKKIMKQKTKNHVESAKDLFERRIRRINPNFFVENPSRKVPRFSPDGECVNWQFVLFAFKSIKLFVSHLEDHSLSKHLRTLSGESAGGRRIWIGI